MATEARQDMVTVGEWGWYDGQEGRIVCNPEDYEAVKAAYDSIPEFDLGPDVLDDVIAAGGHFVREA